MTTSKALVVGSGVLGLRTALELLQKNIRVVLRSSFPPLHWSTCSMGAGGLWMPYKCDDERVDKWAFETLNELLHIHNTIDSPPTEIVPTLFLKSGDFNYGRDGETGLPEWTKDPRLSFQHLTIEMLSWQNHVLKLRIPSEKDLLNAGYTHAWSFYPPIVDPPRMLSKMMNEVQSHPLTESINVEMGAPYNNLEEIIRDARRHDCDFVINCSGLGAARLCNDPNLKGGRGILLNYDRSCSRRKFDAKGLKHDACILTEEGEWGGQEPCYIIPRGNILVVGGSYNELDKEQVMRDDERLRLEKNAWTMGINTKKGKPLNEWVGFRPARGTVCLQMDKSSISSSIRILHCYGTGGSGWTVYSGVAKEAVNLLLSDST